jgi:hypothetical protein
MRVRAIEPEELRRAVSILDRNDCDKSNRNFEETAQLQQRIAALVTADEIDSLTRRDLREVCKAFVHPPTPPVSDEKIASALLKEVMRLNRRAAFFAVIDAYLDGFKPEDENIASLAKTLAQMGSHWPWRDTDHWPEKIDEFELFDPVRAPHVLANRILSGDKPPCAVFEDAGLGTAARQFGGLAEAAFHVACQTVMHRKGDEAVTGQKILIEWARDGAGKFGYKRVWPEFVAASLVPWEIVDPSEAHKSALISMLDGYGGGDPRANQQLWRSVMDNAPGAYSVLMRWLTRASVLQFLDIVDRLMPDFEAKLMWSYRRAFWTSYLLSDGNSPGIDAAWVAFGYDGALLANQAARESGDRSFSAFGRQEDKSSQHAALILQMGDLTIVDWSHSAKYQVWRKGDRGVPKLFEKNYRMGQLYSAPIQESHSSPRTFTWQRRLAQIIEGRHFFTEKPSWRPKRA